MYTPVVNIAVAYLCDMQLLNYALMVYMAHSLTLCLCTCSVISILHSAILPGHIPHPGWQQVGDQTASGVLVSSVSAYHQERQRRELYHQGETHGESGGWSLAGWVELVSVGGASHITSGWGFTWE